MHITYDRLKCYNCKDKHVLVIDGKIVAGADSKKRLSILSGYVQGVYTAEDINDKSVVRVLKPYRDKFMQQNGIIVF